MSGSQTGIAPPSRGSGEAPEPVETSACPKGTLDASACNTRWKLGSAPFGHALDRSAVRSAPSDGGGWLPGRLLLGAVLRFRPDRTAAGCRADFLRRKGGLRLFVRNP